jgi:hypothetical protein
MIMEQYVRKSSMRIGRIVAEFSFKYTFFKSVPYICGIEKRVRLP